MEGNREITSQLINELEKMASNSMLPFERRLIDTAVWFHKNRDRLPREDLGKRVDFLEKTLDIVLELFALALDRQQRNEGRPKDNPLWMPMHHTIRY